MSAAMRKKFPSIVPGNKTCDDCRKTLCERTRANSESSVNLSNISLIANDKSSNDNFGHNTSISDSNNQTHAEDLREIIDDLKEKFSSLSSNDPDRITILTVLPSTWSIKKIVSEFNTSEYSVRKAKELKQLHGSFSRPTPKVGNTLPKSTVDKVINFYEHNENSRLLPGMKNKKSVVENGRKIMKQKRLLLFTVKDLFNKFCEQNSEVRIGFSKFCEVRPKHCVLPGESGTYTVCVYIIHENAKLMLDAIDLSTLSSGLNIPLHNYLDCLNLMVCRARSRDCFLDECENCLSPDILRNNILSMLEKAGIKEITFNSWHSTDRANLKTSTMSIDDYVQSLIRQLEILKPHDFINKEQSSYFRTLKETLKDEEILMICDFSENYAFIVQYAIKPFIITIIRQQFIQRYTTTEMKTN